MKKNPGKPACRMITKVLFAEDNFICAGEAGNPTFSCDNVRLCIKGAVTCRVQEMTVREARTIRDCLSRVLRQLSRR